LDNNLTAAPISHFEKVMEQLRTERVKVDISQGMDLRLLRPEHCIALKGVRMEKQIHFAWDNIEDTKRILDGLALFLSYYKAWRAMVYILIGYNSTPEEDLLRVETLRGLKVDPFVMPFDRTQVYQRRFARWVNHKAIFKTVKWRDYA